MFPHNLKIYKRFHISLNPLYPTSYRCGVFRCTPKLHKSSYILKSSISFIQGVVFSENIQIIAISQISLDPQNPTSWLCRVSNLFSRNVLRIWYILKSSISNILGAWCTHIISNFKKDFINPQILNILHPGGVMFSENLIIIVRSQISLYPQNPWSWLCGVSKFLFQNVF